MKNRFGYIAIIGLLLLFSRCDYKLDVTTRPNDLIPKDTFTHILHDMMVVEAYYSSQPINIQNFYKKIPSAMDTVFFKYKVDTTRFNRSMDYYSDRQQELIDMYQNIQDSLTLDAVKLQQKDSIKK